MTKDQYLNEDATQELLRISKWPDPLRLAYLLEKEMLWPLHGKAADELRRLHEIEKSLAQTSTDIRNATLDEIASKIALMPFGDTAASFAVWIREQKQ